MTLTLYFYHSKCAALCDAPVHHISNVYLYWIKSYGQNSIFDLWPWRLTLTLYFYHSKCAALCDAPVHQISNVYLYWIKYYGRSEKTNKKQADRAKQCAPQILSGGHKNQTDRQTNGQTNGQTDRRMDRRSDYIMPQILFGGIKKTCKLDKGLNHRC